MKSLTPSIQSYCLYMAMILYGCLSSPTPDIIGLPEILVGLLLCLSFRVMLERRMDMLWGVLGYGLAVPTITALVNGHSTIDIIRDIVPFFYIMLPIFLMWVGLFYPERFVMFLAGIGLIFSVRTILTYQPILLTPSLWGQGPPADLLYLANSPEVLFSALFCIGQGGLILMNGQRLKGIAIALLSLIPVVAMALMSQRAGMGAVVAYILVALGYITYYRPRWGGIFMLLIVMVVIVIWPVLEPVLFLLWQKTELVGLNARTQEWAAVINVLSDNWAVMLFGEGWGGRMENPAVGGLNVNFTHSLVSSLLLKTGIVGTLSIMGVCLVPVVRSLRRALVQQDKTDLMIIGAAFLPLMISVFLYASYKSLGLGLILLVFFIFPIRKLEKNQ